MKKFKERVNNLIKEAEKQKIELRKIEIHASSEKINYIDGMIYMYQRALNENLNKTLIININSHLISDPEKSEYTKGMISANYKLQSIL